MKIAKEMAEYASELNNRKVDEALDKMYNQIEAAAKNGRVKTDFMVSKTEVNQLAIQRLESLGYEFKWDEVESGIIHVSWSQELPLEA